MRTLNGKVLLLLLNVGQVFSTKKEKESILSKSTYSPLDQQVEKKRFD